MADDLRTTVKGYYEVTKELERYERDRVIAEDRIRQATRLVESHKQTLAKAMVGQQPMSFILPDGKLLVLDGGKIEIREVFKC